MLELPQLEIVVSYVPPLLLEAYYWASPVLPQSHCEWVIIGLLPVFWC